MSVTVTIHRGEIRQIKKMIKDSGLRKGDLYGLHTESGQPVVQIVCGANDKTKKSSCEEKLREEHSLLKIGEWFVEKPYQSNETLTALKFNDEGKFCSAKYEEQRAKLEIIEGQSAFRLFDSVTKMLKGITGLDSYKLDQTYDDKDDIQWYANSDGEKLFGQIYANLSKYGFTVKKIIRDTITQDMTLLLAAEFNDKLAVSFPKDFPKRNPSVCSQGNVNRQIRMEDVDEKKGQDVAELFCLHLFEKVGEINADVKTGPQGSSQPREADKRDAYVEMKKNQQTEEDLDRDEPVKTTGTKTTLPHLKERKPDFGNQEMTDPSQEKKTSKETEAQDMEIEPQSEDIRNEADKSRDGPSHPQGVGKDVGEKEGTQRIAGSDDKPAPHSTSSQDQDVPMETDGNSFQTQV